MKTLKTTTALVLSVLAFSACDKDKGKNNNTPIAVPGVTAQAYNDYNHMGESCTVNTNNYVCTAYNRSTGTISFDSLNTLCNLLMDESRNLNIAFSTRQLIRQRQCGHMNNGYGYNNGMNNGFNNSGINNGTIMNDPSMKDVACQLYVQKGDRIGDTGLMNVKVQENNGNGVNIFAFINHQIQKRFLGIFNFNANIVSNSEKLAKVKMYLTKQPGKADMIKLEATGVDGDISASVTGYAGSETRLEIASQNEYSDATKLVISCKASSATNIGTAIPAQRYRCVGLEKNGKVETRINDHISYTEDSMNSSYSLTNAVKLHTEGNLATDQGSVILEQIARYSSDSSVSTKANITTPTSISVKRAGYSLKVDCKPSL